MFFTSSYGQKQIPCTGKSCFGHNGTSDISCPNDQQCTIQPPEPLLTQMSYAPHPGGPWSTPVLVPSPGPVDTNMACVIHPNSSLFCMGRPGLGALTASHWKNLSSYSSWTNPTCSGCDFRGEDPVSEAGRAPSLLYVWGKNL